MYPNQDSPSFDEDGHSFPCLAHGQLWSWDVHIGVFDDMYVCTLQLLFFPVEVVVLFFSTRSGRVDTFVRYLSHYGISIIEIPFAADASIDADRYVAPKH